MRKCGADGTEVEGAECGATNQKYCQAGLFCAQLGGDPARCQKYCDDDAGCQLPGGRCVLDVNDPGGVKVCTENCDPVSNSGCSFPGNKCEVAQDDNMAGFSMCMPAGIGGQGAACASSADCSGGHGCLTIDSQQLCRKWCTVNGTCNSCAGAQYGTFPAPGLLIGAVEYGACVN